MNGSPVFSKNLVAKRLMAIWKQEPGVFSMELLSPGRDNQWLWDRRLNIMHYSYVQHCTEKKWLSLNYAEVYTSVMISSPRDQPSHRLQDWSVPSPEYEKGKWNILFIFSKCICKNKLDQRVKWRGEGKVTDVKEHGIVSCCASWAASAHVEHRQCRCSDSLLTVDLNNECYYKDQMFGS